MAEANWIEPARVCSPYPSFYLDGSNPKCTQDGVCETFLTLFRPLRPNPGSPTLGYFWTPRRDPGDPQETPENLQEIPEDLQETPGDPRRPPGDPQETPRRSPGDPRRLPRRSQKNSKLQKATERDSSRSFRKLQEGSKDTPEPPRAKTYIPNCLSGVKLPIPRLWRPVC